MDPAVVLRKARRRTGLTQRELARRTGVAQPTIARIERGREVPRVDTLTRLLEACGESIEVRPRLGLGVDRTLIREMLRLTPAERLASLEEEAAFSAALDRAMAAVADLDDLIRMKLAASRPKDSVEVEILGTLRDER